MIEFEEATLLALEEQRYSVSARGKSARYLSLLHRKRQVSDRTGASEGVGLGETSALVG